MGTAANPPEPQDLPGTTRRMEQRVDNSIVTPLYLGIRVPCIGLTRRPAPDGRVLSFSLRSAGSLRPTSAHPQQTHANRAGPGGGGGGEVHGVATYATSGACASSRDALRADSDLRAYGPCHRRDGTAGNPELLQQIKQPGLDTASDDYGPAATCRSMDLAAAAGARATRMSQLWAGEAAGGRGHERHRATGPTTTRPPGAGRRVSPEHGTRSCHERQWEWHVQGYCFDSPLLFLIRVQPLNGSGTIGLNASHDHFSVTTFLG
jgi:hypothetical protein